MQSGQHRCSGKQPQDENYSLIPAALCILHARFGAARKQRSLVCFGNWFPRRVHMQAAPKVHHHQPHAQLMHQAAATDKMDCCEFCLLSERDGTQNSTLRCRAPSCIAAVIPLHRNQQHTTCNSMVSNTNMAQTQHATKTAAASPNIMQITLPLLRHCCCQRQPSSNGLRK